MKANSKQLSTKSKAATTSMSLQSSQLSIQNTPKTLNETNNNEELVSIRKVVKEELEDHKKKICEILKLHLETANQRLNKILDEVVELTKSLEFTQAYIKEEITNTKDNLNQVKTEIQELGDFSDPDYVANKLIELEDGSQHSNICIDGIEEEQHETWDRCEVIKGYQRKVRY